HFPRPDRTAADAVQAWAHSQGTELNPDEVEAVTLHYQWHNNRWFAKISQRLTLTQALLANWQGESANDLIGAALGAPWAGNPPPGDFTLVEELPYHKSLTALENGAEYAVYNGLYRRTTVPEYSTRTHVALPVERFQAFIWQLDFAEPYLAMLDRYWANQLGTYALAAKLACLAACNKQVREGSLTRAGQQLVWQAARVTDELTAALRVAPLNIYGYAATDLLCLEHITSGTTVLYIPGNASPLLEFANLDGMRLWVAEQCKDLGKRQALKAHFALRDGPDGLSYSGLDTALAGLALFPQPHHFAVNHEGFATSGRWDPQVFVHYHPVRYSPPLSGDPFEALASRQKRRSFEDASFLITSDAQAGTAKWRDYLGAELNLLAPLTLAVPELAPLFAASGLAQFGLGLDQALHGKTDAAQSAGAATAVFGLLNAVPLLQGPGFEPGELFAGKRDGFVLPARVNGQLGYPLSPVDPPQWPAASLAEYFHAPEPLVPLPGSDAAVAGAVVRVPQYSGGQDLLQASIDGRNVNVLYDVQADAFIAKGSETAEAPVYYRASAEPGIDLVPVVGMARVATDEQRMRTLRALGIDLALPIDLEALLGDPGEPIPKVFSSLWVGGQPLSDTLLGNLGTNARLLKAAGYRYRLYLSRATPGAYAQNLARLQARAPALEVLPLEDQPLFGAFERSAYYPQYHTALHGNGHNYASAADILRYRLLHHEGGVYMDLDDRLLYPGQYVIEPGQGYAQPAEALVLVPLNTSPTDLLLYPPASHERLGLHVQYNTSLIGSHPGNPTLDAISEEIRRRFEQAADFYTSKPSLAHNPMAFYRYAAELSRLTGPGVFNAVIQQHCPQLYQLRQLANLAACPHVNGVARVDLQQYQAVVKARLPFSRFATLGHASSWQQ
ncbi:dermonecrotic toxin domain-containing protein, partial [Pseudomonas typographi]